MEQRWPLSTGQVAALLGVPEHRVTSQIRLAKVNPPMLMGRKAWAAEHVLAVARIIGRDTLEVRNACRQSDDMKGGAG